MSAFKPWPASIMGRTIAVLLLGLTLVMGIMAVQLYWERQTLLADFGGWHVVTRIAGVVQVIEDTPQELRTATLRPVQGAGFRVIWSQESLLEDRHLHWQGRLIRDALETQLGELKRDSIRIGLGELKVRQPTNMPEGMGNMQRRMHPLEDFPRQVMIVSLRLGDGTWLNFAMPSTPRQALWSSRLFLGSVVGLLVVVVLSIWAVRRATKPLNLFARAAERLGTDFNAQPLDETGPREVRRAAKAFNQMQQRLQTFVGNRTHMLAAISHDLRTPITRLKLRAEFVEDEEQREKMLADLDEMEAMIAATLQFARDDAANEPAQRLDLAELVRNLCDGDGLTCSLPEAVPFLGRPLALKRLVGNLVGNAQRFGEKVEVSLEATDGEVVLRVVDDGPGIPEDMLGRVFDPFVRVETSRSRDTGGVGLGLSAVKTIAEAHGGRVDLINREAGGLEARVTLPRTGLD